MSDNQQPLTLEQQKQNVEGVRDLFARAHDYIAQANHPGHLGAKVAEVLNFLAFHYNDFKVRGENLAKQIENEAKALASKVDVEAAKALTAEVIGTDANSATTASSLERPKVQ